MIRYSGFCSGKRETSAKRTPVGGAAPTAGRERPYCAASANTAARFPLRPSLKFRHCLYGISTGIAKRRRQTWTFSEQTKLNPRGRQ